MFLTRRFDNQRSFTKSIVRKHSTTDNSRHNAIVFCFILLFMFVPRADVATGPKYMGDKCNWSDITIFNLHHSTDNTSVLFKQ